MPRSYSTTRAALSLVKRAEAAGMKVSRFEVEPATGRVVVHLSNGEASPAPTPLQAWGRTRGAR